jgi:hypothetical protein
MLHLKPPVAKSFEVFPQNLDIILRFKKKKINHDLKPK